MTSVQHNMNALNAYNKLNANVAGMKKSSEKLSSGYRINRAGDDAAGLAISEKMRSQIRGLNQAVRNSQDGINMIQTFEGAAQETHSILQRMKELATESANGTYDNATARAAIQLEFDQLNDELNQIADTDFNGTIVLNGGVMSDGLEAVNNEFNYKTRAEQEAAAKEANEKLLASAEDFCGDDDGVGAILDNSAYGKKDADVIWNALGIKPTSTDTANPDEITLSFGYDGSKWVATGVYDKEGKAIDVSEDALKALSDLIVPVDTNTAGATGAGGFKIKGTSLNLVFDTDDVQKYDTASIKVQNINSNNRAPANAGIAEGDAGASGITWGTPDAGSTDGGQITVEMLIKDEDMTAEMKEILDNLKTQDFGFDYGKGGTITWEDLTDLAEKTGVTAGGEFSFNGNKLQFTAKGGEAVDILEFKFTGFDADLEVDGNTFNVNFDSYAYIDDTQLKAQSTETTAKPTVDMFDKAAASGGVSESDAFKHSTAILTYAEDITLQTGARSKDAVNFTFLYNKADMGDLEANLNISARKEGLNTENLKLSNQSDANDAIDQIDKAINKVSMVRASFGAIQNRLEHKITNLTTTSENLTEAESSIRDTDMASEMMNYTKFNILQQAAQSMLAQANQQPQSILQLLG